MSSDTRSILRGLMIGGGIAVALMLGALLAGFFPLRSAPVSAAPPTAPDNDFAPDPTPVSAPTNIPDPPLSPTSSPEKFLAEQILQTLPEYGGDWNILIREDGQRDIFSYHAEQKNHVASMIKVSIAMLFFKALEEKGVAPAEYAGYLSTSGIGRTYLQLLNAMLVDSEEAAAGILRGFIADSGLDVNAALQAWGAVNTDPASRRSTPDDIAALYESLYFGNAIAPEGRQIILDLLSAYTPNDETRLGMLRLFLPPGGKFYNKRGTVTEGRLVIGDSALLTWNQNGREKIYVIVIAGYNGQIPTTDVKLERGVQAVANLFWDFVVSENR